MDTEWRKTMENKQQYVQPVLNKDKETEEAKNSLPK